MRRNRISDCFLLRFLLAAAALAAAPATAQHAL